MYLKVDTFYNLKQLQVLTGKDVYFNMVINFYFVSVFFHTFIRSRKKKKICYILNWENINF